MPAVYSWTASGFVLQTFAHTYTALFLLDSLADLMGGLAMHCSGGHKSAEASKFQHDSRS